MTIKSSGLYTLYALTEENTFEYLQEFDGTRYDVRYQAREASKIDFAAVAIVDTKSGRPGINTEMYVNGNPVTLQRGNIKVGQDVYTLTFPAGCGCPKDCGCYTEKTCYGMNGCFVFKDVQAAHLNNWLAYNSSWRVFAVALDFLIKAYTAKKIRLLVAGDADKYFPEVACYLAENNPGVTFHEFTKQYDTWNAKIAVNLMSTGRLYPANMYLLYSVWPGYELINPYNVPAAVYVPIGEAAPNNALACGGCCSNCMSGGAGCMAARIGQAVAIYEHSTPAARKLKNADDINCVRVHLDRLSNVYICELLTAAGVTTAAGLDTLTAVCNAASIGGYNHDDILNNFKSLLTA